MESAFFRDFFWEFFPREVKNIILRGGEHARWDCWRRVLFHARWVWVVEGTPKLTSRACEVGMVNLSHVHARWVWLVEGTPKLTSCGTGDVTPVMSKGQMIKIWRIPPYIGSKLTSRAREMKMPNLSCVHARWVWVVEGTPKTHLAWARDRFHPKTHLACMRDRFHPELTSRELETGFTLKLTSRARETGLPFLPRVHARWVWVVEGTPKLTSRGTGDITPVMSKGQMIKICRIPSYIGSKLTSRACEMKMPNLSRVHARWVWVVEETPKTHLASPRVS